MNAETPEDTAAGAAAAARRRTVLLLGVAGAVVAVDQAVKRVVLDALSGDPGPTVLVDGWLQLRLAFNSGAAFSMGTGSTWVFTLIATAVSGYILWLSLRVRSAGWALALGLLLGGAVGNLVDRLLRAPGFGRGHVIDFIESLKVPWPGFPIFNLADSCIVCAAFLIALLGWRGIGVDGSRGPAGAVHPKDPSDPVAPGA